MSEFLPALMLYSVYQAVIEESKEADRTTGQATHRISRGIHDKVSGLSEEALCFVICCIIHIVHFKI